MYCKTCTVTGFSGLNYKTDLSSFIVRRSHNHSADMNLIEKKVNIENMKSLILNSNVSPRNIVSTVLRGCNINLLRIIGRFELVYRILRRYVQQTSIQSPILIQI